MRDLLAMACCPIATPHAIMQRRAGTIVLP